MIWKVDQAITITVSESTRAWIISLWKVIHVWSINLQLQIGHLMNCSKCHLSETSVQEVLCSVSNQVDLENVDKHIGYLGEMKGTVWPNCSKRAFRLSFLQIQCLKWAWSSKMIWAWCNQDDEFLMKLAVLDVAWRSNGRKTNFINKRITLNDKNISLETKFRKWHQKQSPDWELFGELIKIDVRHCDADCIECLFHRLRLMDWCLIVQGNSFWAIHAW
jgi:hypothetical protein